MSTQCEFRGQWTAHSCCRTAPSGVSAAMTRPLQRTSVHSPRTRPRSFAQSEDGDVCRFWCSVLLLLPILGCYLVWEHKTGVSQLAHHTQPRELHTRNSPTFKSVVSDSDQAQALIDEKPHSTAPARFGQMTAATWLPYSAAPRNCAASPRDLYYSPVQQKQPGVDGPFAPSSHVETSGSTYGEHEPHQTGQLQRLAMALYLPARRFLGGAAHAVQKSADVMRCHAIGYLRALLKRTATGAALYDYAASHTWLLTAAIVAASVAFYPLLIETILNGVAVCMNWFHQNYYQKWLNQYFYHHARGLGYSHHQLTVVPGLCISLAVHPKPISGAEWTGDRHYHYVVAKASYPVLRAYAWAMASYRWVCQNVVLQSIWLVVGLQKSLVICTGIMLGVVIMAVVKFARLVWYMVNRVYAAVSTCSSALQTISSWLSQLLFKVVMESSFKVLGFGSWSAAQCKNICMWCLRIAWKCFHFLISSQQQQQQQQQQRQQQQQQTQYTTSAATMPTPDSSASGSSSSTRARVNNSNSTSRRKKKNNGKPTNNSSGRHRPNSTNGALSPADAASSSAAAAANTAQGASRLQTADSASSSHAAEQSATAASANNRMVPAQSVAGQGDDVMSQAVRGSVAARVQRMLGWWGYQRPSPAIQPQQQQHAAGVPHTTIDSCADGAVLIQEQPEADVVRRDAEDDDNSCRICFDAASSYACLHGEEAHLCLCAECAQQKRDEFVGRACPMCRATVEKLIRVW